MDYLVDTNVLIYAVQNRVDLEEQLGKKPIVAKQVLQELEKLSTKEAKLALQIAKAKKFKVIDLGAGHTDNLIVKYAKTHDVTTITNDARLRRRLKNKNLKVKFLRQGRILGD